MPWTRRQVKKLLSSGSPLSEEQKDKMKSELHADPALGHAKKGSVEMKRGPRSKRLRRGLNATRRGNQHMSSESYSYHY